MTTDTATPLPPLSASTTRLLLDAWEAPVDSGLADYLSGLLSGRNSETRDYYRIEWTGHELARVAETRRRTDLAEAALLAVQAETLAAMAAATGGAA